MLHVLLTGGAGYIGSVLIGNLLERGFKVTVLDRCFFGHEPLITYLRYKDFRVVQEDIRYFDAAIMTDVDVVMDLAGLANDPAGDLDPNITLKINYEGCARVAQLAKDHGVKRYILSSSCSVYGHGQNLSLNEKSETHPVSVYAQSKKMAEEKILTLADDNFCVTCLRNATAYGLSPKMRFDLVINVMTLYAYKHKKIYVLGGGSQWRPVVHVQDVCRAFLTIAEADPLLVNGEIFNVGSNDQNYQVIHLANLVSNGVPDTIVECIPDDPDKRTYHVNFDKITQVLGYVAEKKPPYGIEEIFQALRNGILTASIKTKTVDYYKYLMDAERTLNEVMYNGRLF